MAAIDAKQLLTQFRGFSRLPALRQLGLMAGLAASVAIGVAIVMWSQSPSYSLLYGGLSNKDRAAVISALAKDSIPYRIDTASGAILVPQSRVYKARIQLAAEGLPHERGSSYDILSKNQGFGTSSFVEHARYNHMLEQQLARSIMSIDAIDKASVRLAIPKQSVFVDAHRNPSASVIVQLYAGRSLDSGQVAGIVHLVAASVPGLLAKNVSVVNQRGQLLTRQNQDNGVGLTDQEFAFTRRIEQAYQHRVEQILAPIVGADGVRAQVVANLDFTRVDKTTQNYNGAKPALRSEQTSEDIKRGGSADASGVPGSLSNQPPQAGVTQASSSNSSSPNASSSQSSTTNSSGNQQSQPVETRKQSTRNYELDQTISHIQQSPGQVKRLSVAVVINDKTVKSAKGKVKHEPYSKAQMAQFVSLVKEAVGFDKQRGDTVNVINAEFRKPAPSPAVSGPPIWEQPYFQTILKDVLGALGVALLLLGVMRPAMRGLAQKGSLQLATTAGELPADGAAAVGAEGVGAEGLPAGEGGGLRQALSSATPESNRPQSIQYAENLAAAKSMAKEDPKRVAQVVKSWLGDDEPGA